MKTHQSFNEPDDAIKKPVKTLSLQLAVSKPDFQTDIKVVFDLAKSAGRELDLTFNPPAYTGTAPLALPRLGC